MSVFRSRPALRWLVPSAAAVLVIGGGAAAGTIAANAGPSLPERSAAQLLVDLQNAKVDGLSGTIVQTADLGLPPLAGLTGGQGDADLTKLVAGSNTARVWYAGDDKVRLALLGTLGETDVIRNGTSVWVWRSRDNTASQLTLRAGSAERPAPLASVDGSSAIRWRRSVAASLRRSATRSGPRETSSTATSPASCRGERPCTKRGSRRGSVPQSGSTRH